MKDYLVDPHVPWVWNFCSRMMVESDKPEDAVIETFRRVYWGSEIAPSELRDLEYWTLKIANHVVSKIIPGRAFAAMPIKRHALKDPTALLQGLPLGERAAVVLSVCMGIPDVHVARIVDAKLSALKVRISRARHRIEELVSPLGSTLERAITTLSSCEPLSVPPNLVERLDHLRSPEVNAST